MSTVTEKIEPAEASASEFYVVRSFIDGQLTEKVLVKHQLVAGPMTKSEAQAEALARGMKAVLESFIVVEKSV